MNSETIADIISTLNFPNGDAEIGCIVRQLLREAPTNFRGPLGSIEEQQRQIAHSLAEAIMSRLPLYGDGYSLLYETTIMLRSFADPAQLDLPLDPPNPDEINDDDIPF
ncbi:hypothetical protein [Bradyrhizobium sp. STM 3809]|uniref:hypothetical protein n=1 Tax=Bradyrhizobium sp. STM 3809 TaxID=551936 RepID=UPI0002406545|nr:hypothetical protein [Bradyrhizobium sp. STM 3809]CCD97625.1 hypothetical protein BRAS3809_1160007 [Bradyrhizobium sp. STM 3809]